MLTIFKYPLPTAFDFYIEMPISSQLLTVQVQDEKPVLWAMVNKDAITEKRQFKLVYTGNNIDFIPKAYIGTFQLDYLVYHLFEV